MPGTGETYLHGHHDSVLRSHRWRTAENSAGYLLPRLQDADRVLDVGCGPGTITVDLAARVPHGEVVGIDAAGNVLEDARQEASRQGRSNVRFDTGDVYHLAFNDAAFDVVHAHQVLQHLGDPVAALAEMRRVCRPGGLVAARDSDYGGMLWVPDDEPSASAWCYAPPADGSWWGSLWAERLTESPFGDRAVEHGLATRQDLERLADAWLRWAASDDGWFLIPHGEVLCRVPG